MSLPSTSERPRAVRLSSSSIVGRSSCSAPGDRSASSDNPPRCSPPSSAAPASWSPATSCSGNCGAATRSWTSRPASTTASAACARHSATRPATPTFIETLRGRGYRFVAPVQRVGNTARTIAGAPLRQHRRRPVARVRGRRRGRRPDYRAGQDRRASRHLAAVGARLQGQHARDAGDREALAGRHGARRLGAAPRRSSADHGAVDRGRTRAAPVGRELRRRSRASSWTCWSASRARLPGAISVVLAPRGRGTASRPPTCSSGHATGRTPRRRT